MLKAVFTAACLGCAAAAQAATIQLKDKAEVTGNVLAEKPDQIVVDIGYTVLVIPKAQIVKITGVKTTPTEVPAPMPAPASVPAVALPATPHVPSGGFYSGGLANAKENAVRDLVLVLGEAVVQVRTPGGLGSGFVINDEGYLITNFHVIQDETQISVEVYRQSHGQLERTVYKDVRIVSINKFADLALLKLEDKNSGKFLHVNLGSAEDMAVGERVFAIGSPLGLERTVTEGIISTKTRQIEGELYLQTTAQINPGNSGGPLFNLRGEVIGVTNMKAIGGEGLGFAIPVEMVKFFLNHRDAYAYDNDNPSNPYRYLEPPSRLKRTAVK